MDGAGPVSRAAPPVPRRCRSPRAPRTRTPGSRGPAPASAGRAPPWPPPRPPPRRRSCSRPRRGPRPQFGALEIEPVDHGQRVLALERRPAPAREPRGCSGAAPPGRWSPARQADARDPRRPREHQRVRGLPRLARQQLGVGEAARGRGKEPRVVEHDGGRHQRPGQTAPPGFVGARPAGGRAARPRRLRGLVQEVPVEAEGIGGPPGFLARLSGAIGERATARRCGRQASRWRRPHP